MYKKADSVRQPTSLYILYRHDGYIPTVPFSRTPHTEPLYLFQTRAKRTIENAQIYR